MIYEKTLKTCIRKKSSVNKMEQKRKNVLKGCIKTSKGPWKVRRATKDGGLMTKFRYPSDRERLNNQERERKRRSVASKIFSGLKAHGNYNLPKHADSNDLLKALCEEAGWHVEEDGTIFRKQVPSLVDAISGDVEDDDEYCKCGDGDGDVMDSACQGGPDTTLTL